MDDTSVRKSFERFGLPSDASVDEIKQAFRELCDFYSKKSLATYSLIDEEVRREKLLSLQADYDQIMQARLLDPSREERSKVPEDSAPIPADELPDVVIDADPTQNPGLFLQQMRKARGLSLRDVAEWTKVSTVYLQGIEQHNFDNLPAPVYVRGFLKAFCQKVKILEAGVLIDHYMGLYQNR